MAIKDELMVVVRAFKNLIGAPSVADQQLRDAQKQIADLKAADALTDAEQKEVDEALAMAAAATPAPAPAPTPAPEPAPTGATGATA